VINRRAGEERGSPARVRVRFAVGCAETSALGLPHSQPITTLIPPLSGSDVVVHPPRRPAGFQGGYRFCEAEVFSDRASFCLAVLLHRTHDAPIRRSRDQARRRKRSAPSHTRDGGCLEMRSS